MSLDHTFGLVHCDRCDAKAFLGLGYADMRTRIEMPVAIHDDLLHYIGDTLRWIPTYDPSKNEDQFGLNFWGITIITSSGAEVSRCVFEGWSSLFAVGPSKLTLTGHYEFAEDSAKSEVVKKLNGLGHICEQVLQRPEGAFLLHFGI
jgi:hypothetical protein